MNCWVEPLEFDAGIGSSEAPIDGGGGGVAGGYPGGDLALHGRPGSRAAIQALALQYAQLDLGCVQPRPERRGVVDLQLVGQALGLDGRERLVEGGRGVGVELVHDEDDTGGLGVVNIDQILDTVRPVDAGALVAEPHVTPVAP